MLNRKILAIVGATIGLAFAPAPAIAQDQASDTYRPGVTTSTGNETTTVRGERVLPGRVGGNRQQRRQGEGRQRSQAPVPTPTQTPEELKVTAQVQATAAAPSCQVTEATLLGMNAEQQPIYEAACAAGPGFILISTTPAQAVDCVVLAGQADLDLQRDPAADTGLQCKLAANTDVARVIGTYAQEAGVACAVDQGASIGKSTTGNFIYEVGCTGMDGYWIEKTPTGWEKTECLTVVTQSAACRFTTPVEQAATVKTRLAGSPAAACDVTEARYMGANANGSFYEAKCAAGDGYVARFDAAGAVQQTYPCVGAVRVGGGCKLTTIAPAAASAPEPAATPAPATRR